MLFRIINNIGSLKVMNGQMLSPQAPKIARSDSLVFSITAEKDDSPHDTDLLKDSYQMEASREIDSLNNKLGALENKVKSIKTQQVDSSLKIFDQDENIDISNLTLGEQQFKVGRFHKKQALKQPLRNKMELTNPITNNTSATVTRRVNCTYSHESRASHHSRSQKSHMMSRQKQADNEIKSLRKQMLKLRLKMQKSQRSKSQCSERLSQTKSNIKILQNQKKNNEKLINNLAKDLKKSENIRKKQKQTIMKQKKQIEELKKIITILKTQLKV